MRWKRINGGMYRSEFTMRRPGGTLIYQFWISKQFEGYMLRLSPLNEPLTATETWGPFNTVTLAKKVAAAQVGR